MKFELKGGQKQLEIGDLIFKAKEEKEVSDRYLTSYELKEALLSGTLKLLSGEFIIQVKMAKILFSDTFPNFCYGLEWGKFFKKDLVLDTIYWIDKDDLPNEVYDKLMGFISLKNEEIKSIEEIKPVENILDLNKDGVIDKKDGIIASKVLNEMKKEDTIIDPSIFSKKSSRKKK